MLKLLGGRQLRTAIATLAFAGWSAGVASGANVLFNANLDTIDFGPQNGQTPVGWSVSANKALSGAHFDGCSSEPWCNVVDSGGYGLFFKPFQGQVGDEISVFFYQDNPTTPGTKFTLSGYAAGEPNYCGYFTTNSPAPQTLFVIQFLDNSSTVIASNGFDLIAAGLPNSGPGSMSGFLYTTPEVTAPPGTATVRAGAAMLNAYSTSGGQSFFVDAFDLQATAPPGSPVITNQPAATTVAPGGIAVFSVGIANPTGVSYQWQKNGAALSDGGNISGASTATLSISGASASDVAHYRVLVSNGSGGVYSSDAPLALFNLGINPVITLTGKAGDTYRVDYSTTVAPTTWIPLSTNKLTSSSLKVIDPASGTSGNRFYRAVFLY
jgi:hypothetical protein